jgi:hypothetical protein
LIDERCAEMGRTIPQESVVCGCAMQLDCAAQRDVCNSKRALDEPCVQRRGAFRAQ